MAKRMRYKQIDYLLTRVLIADTAIFVLYLICCKARKFSGQIALCYGIWYGLERTVVEGLRTDSLYIAGTTIRVSQALSAAIALVCAVLLVVLLIKFKKNPRPIDGVDYFLELELQKQNTPTEPAAVTENVITEGEDSDGKDI